MNETRIARIADDVVQVRKDVETVATVLRGVIEDADFLYARREVLASGQLASRVDNIRDRAKYALRKLTGEES